MASGPPPVGSPRRLGIREEHGPARRRGDLEVVPVARVYEARLGVRGVTVGAVLARPHRVEVRRDGSPRESVAIPDWNLRIAIGALLLAAVVWLVERKRP